MNKGILKDSFKVLAIGNSFSVDSMEYLASIAHEKGFKNVVLGNLYIGGCTIERHYNNALNNSQDYVYYKNVNNTWNDYYNKTILDGIKDEQWDVITMQQASGVSGVKESYKDLDKLIDYVNMHKNEEAKLVWNMTWAYEQDSTHPEFINYQNDQIIMYQSIINVINEVIIPKNIFSLIIPVGIAIQLARSSYIGDKLTRDGFHLDYKYGRLLASLTWFKSLTLMDISDVKYNPDTTIIDSKMHNTLIKCAEEAALSFIK